MELKIIAISMVLHFIADFLLQSRKMGKTKSENLKVLHKHISINALVFLLGLSMSAIFMDSLSVLNILLFVLGNSLFHGIIDWNIWRIYKKYAINKIISKAKNKISNKVFLVGRPKDQIYMEKLDCLMEAKANFKYWEDHWFYVTIGADQLLHMLTIVVFWAILL